MYTMHEPLSKALGVMLIMEYGKNKKKALQMSTFPLVVSPYKCFFMQDEQKF